jgi:hypothetical protein
MEIGSMMKLSSIADQWEGGVEAKKASTSPLFFIFRVIVFFGGALDDVDSCLTDYLGCWSYVQQTKQGYVYRHVAIKIWGTNYECVLSNGGGSWLARRPGQARPGQAKRERERMKKYKV